MSENMNEAMLGALTTTISILQKQFMNKNNCDVRYKFALLAQLLELRHERGMMVERLVHDSN